MQLKEPTMPPAVTTPCKSRPTDEQEVATQKVVDKPPAKAKEASREPVAVAEIVTEHVTQDVDPELKDLELENLRLSATPCFAQEVIDTSGFTSKPARYR